MPVQSFPLTDKYKRLIVQAPYFNGCHYNRGLLLDETMLRYDEPHRAYHTREHIEEMFTLFDKVMADPKFCELDRVVGALAIIYHDAIYQTDTPQNIADNEMNSANLALNHIIDGFKPNGEEIGLRVERMIMATKDHEIDPDVDPLGAVVIDIDMAILGADEFRYEEYKKAIRCEFSAFPDSVFYAARRDGFLLPTVRKSRLFLTDVMEDKFGDDARDNMLREIGELNTALRVGLPPVYNRVPA